MSINWSRRGYSKEDFIAAWNSSLSIAQVLVRLGKAPKGGNYKTAKAAAVSLGLDDSHMTGKGWNAGERYQYPGVKISLEEILVEDSTYTSSHALKLRLLKDGIFERECSKCHLREWMGQEIPLALDHINGVNNDNRLDNLRLLCYNCHGQTDTYCGKNKSKK